MIIPAMLPRRRVLQIRTHAYYQRSIFCNYLITRYEELTVNYVWLCGIDIVTCHYVDVDAVLCAKIPSLLAIVKRVLFNEI